MNFTFLLDREHCKDYRLAARTSGMRHRAPALKGDDGGEATKRLRPKRGGGLTIFFRRLTRVNAYERSTQVSARRPPS